MTTRRLAALMVALWTLKVKYTKIKDLDDGGLWEFSTLRIFKTETQTLQN